MDVKKEAHYFAQENKDIILGFNFKSKTYWNVDKVWKMSIDFVLAMRNFILDVYEFFQSCTSGVV
jgi:hypothetical protein